MAFSLLQFIYFSKNEPQLKEKLSILEGGELNGEEKDL